MTIILLNFFLNLINKTPVSAFCYKLITQQNDYFINKQPFINNIKIKNILKNILSRQRLPAGIFAALNKFLSNALFNFINYSLHLTFN